MIKRLSYGMPNYMLKPMSNALIMGKVLSAAPAAIPIRLSPTNKPYLSGLLNEIEKSIKVTARTITLTCLKDKVRSEIVLIWAGLRSLTEAVVESMACLIWKSRKEMDPLGRIFQKKQMNRNTRSATSDKLCEPVPGHPEAASNRLAKIWNMLNLNCSKTLGSVKSVAREWYRRNSNNLN